jgi:CRP/FNR family transcriptional regulator
MAAAATEPVRVLLQTYLFKDLAPAELEQLAAGLTVRSYGRGEAVCRLGDPAHCLYVIATGQLKSSLLSVDGEEIVVDVTTAGGVMGEPGLFARERNRIVDMSATEPTTLLEIRRDALIDFLLKHPPVMLRLLEGLASGSRSSVETIADLAFVQIRERVARKLLDLVSTHGDERADGSVELALSVSQGMLAGMVAASRENVNRALQQLSVSGDVVVDDGHFVITSTTRLQRRVDRGWPPLHRRNQRLHAGSG